MITFTIGDIIEYRMSFRKGSIVQGDGKSWMVLVDKIEEDYGFGLLVDEDGNLKPADKSGVTIHRSCFAIEDVVRVVRRVQ